MLLLYKQKEVINKLLKIKTMESLKEKRKFIVKSSHEVYLDDYENGYIKSSNFYNMSAEIEANTAKEAIVKFIEKNLYWRIDDDFDLVVEDGAFHCATLVDKDGIEASKNEINIWKNGEIKLYSDTATISIYEMIKLDSI